MPHATRALTAWVTKGRATALAAAVLLSLAAAGCGEPLPEPIDLVPADANFVANIELGRILLDADVAGGFESVPPGPDGPASLDDALAEIEAETGIDLLQFSRIVAFGTVDPAATSNDQTGDQTGEQTGGQMGFGSGGDFGLLARGTFDGDAILDNVRLGSEGQLREEEYRGHALLIGAEADGSETVMTVLGDEVFVLGTRAAVTSVIDVLEDGGALSGPLLDTYVALGDPLVKAAFAVPPGAVDDLGGVPADAIPIPFDPSLLTEVRTVGFAADKVDDVVTLEVQLEYVSAETAQEASEFLQALLTLAGPFVPPGAAADLIDLIDVSHAEATVTISFSATVDQLTAAAEEYGEPGPTPVPE